MIQVILHKIYLIKYKNLCKKVIMLYTVIPALILL